MKNRFLKIITTAGLLLGSLSAAAEDIDLFVGARPTETSAPNVLFVIDNTANWNNAFTNEMAALISTLNALPEDKFRIGILFSAETGNGNNNTSGGYVRAAIRLMDAVSKPVYANLAGSFDKLKDKGNGGKSSLVMAEAYLYLSGGAPYAGNGKIKTDYTGNNNPSKTTVQDRAVYALADNALASIDGTSYNKPDVSGCRKTFVIYISNGAPQDNSTVIGESRTILLAEAAKLGIAAADAEIPVSPSGSSGNLSNEWARLLKKSPLAATTYTIDIDKVTTGAGPGWTALLKNMATVSKGKYFDVSSGDGGKEIAAALLSIFSEVQAVNSVFASVSLPVSVNTQGTYLNQMFIGMFRPDEIALPRWAGNLKQYKMGYGSTGKLTTLDADGTDAINFETNFISECARSFWTPTAVDTYWTFDPQGSCLVAGAAESNSPDGNIVEKGAQAYKLRSTTTRTVKTCNAGCTALTDFTNSIAPEALGLLATDTAGRDTLVKWAKGLDVQNEREIVPIPASPAMRPSVHGDVVHSRPVAINFGAGDTTATAEVVVFYGGNDGMLRAVNGNRDGGQSIGGHAPGMELWSFMPPEFYPYIKRIHDNTVPISFKGMEAPIDATAPIPLPKPYGMDGAVSTFKNGGATWILSTMRRGGRSVYAFDVSSPANPELKWKVGCPSQLDDAGCTSGFTDIGQTWSTPRELRVPGTTDTLLVMGGGYDTCEDADPNTCGGSTKGNGIYVLNAVSGTLLKTLDTDRAVVADVLVVPDKTTGLAKLAYAADLGGNVYRINIGAAAPDAWTITKVASFGGSGTDDRKFMFAPDVVLHEGKYVVLLGSGDREKPLSDYTHAASVANKFFMFTDDPEDPDWLSSESVNCGAAVICKNSLMTIGITAASPTVATVAEYKGWALDLREREQVVTSALTIFGVVSFSTQQPNPVNIDPNVCTTDLGNSFSYNVLYTTAAAGSSGNRSEEIVGGGLPPSPVGGSVTLDNGETVPFCIGCSSSPLDATDPPAPSWATQPKSRVYWQIEQ
ncbi:MAG: type pilus assembly protein PilY1 [Pseudomonadota bacterium]|nr:type pilus assembly protein PilY1 [Pseudomonadota bacterium]